MTTTGGGPRRDETRSRERYAESFLVRMWREPAETEGAEGALRCYVRNLRTGEEAYLSDPREIAARLERALAAGPGRSEAAGEGAA